MALKLGDNESLRQHHLGTQHVTSFNHYPSLPIDLLRAGEAARSPCHSDFGTLTLLFQRGVSGLEIADMSSTEEFQSVPVEKTATFIPVDPDPEAIIVFGGYLMTRWTNRRWRGAVHRVTAPRGLEGGVETPERYSIVFFANPERATMVKPVSSCENHKDGNTYGPINAGKYFDKKRRDVYSPL